MEFTDLNSFFSRIFVSQWDDEFGILFYFLFIAILSTLSAYELFHLSIFVVHTDEITNGFIGENSFFLLVEMGIECRNAGTVHEWREIKSFT